VIGILGSWPGDELYLLPEGERLQVLVPPFARHTVTRIAATDLYTADTDRNEMRVLSVTGQPHSIIRWRDTARPATAAALDATVRERYRNLSDGPALQQRLDEQKRMAIHETIPAFSTIRIASDQEVWIGDYALPGDSLVMLTGVNVPEATAEHLLMPARLEPLAFCHSHVIVLMRDDADRERIARYRLIRPD